MEESRENPNQFQTKSCFSKEKSRANLLLFSKFGAA
jgi:hypothetical protein